MKRSTKIMIGCWILAGVFYISAWISTPFADWYTNTVFPIWAETYGRLTSLFSVSVGERMIVAGLLLILIDVVLLLLLLSERIYRHFHSGKEIASKAGSMAAKLRHFFFRGTAIILTIVWIIMNLNCFVLYHCTTFASEDDYSLEELAQLRDDIVTHVNALSLEMSRDADGNIVYDGDMQETARKAVANLGATLGGQYARLSGYSVTPKILTFSDFMSQQYMQGYYFPFSMEANINGMMSISNKPFTMCHELSHTHGYIYEDEANLIGFLACINSGDLFFQYSGYLGVLNYVNNDFYTSVDKATYNSHVAISDLVKYDNQFLTEESWAEVESKAVLSTETVKNAASTFIDSNLKTNGVKEGEASYDHVVALLMEYYDYQ